MRKGKIDEADHETLPNVRPYILMIGLHEYLAFLVPDEGSVGEPTERETVINPILGRANYPRNTGYCDSRLAQEH